MILTTSRATCNYVGSSGLLHKPGAPYATGEVCRGLGIPMLRRMKIADRSARHRRPLFEIPPGSARPVILPESARQGRSILHTLENLPHDQRVLTIGSILLHLPER